MRFRVGQPLGYQPQQVLSLYVFALALFATGIAFGALAIGFLSPTQKHELSGSLGLFFSELRHGGVAEPELAFRYALGYHFKVLGLLWLLGLSVVGLPFIVVVVFLKGMVLGFTVGLLVSQSGWEGFLFALTAVVPPNLLVVPAVLVMSVAGMAFSLSLIRHHFLTRRQSLWPAFLRYAALVPVSTLALAVASWFQAYLSPAMMRLVAQMVSG
ncbi:stage II sporulation protein M [Calditerricola satsumensis]|uniref:Stage II sporulation protein M n=1 Tax=Calditerricola satsumensis TaxID=373054 RepID=A0A8J3BA75_9BACI|nr:stage II sporulation protein M [Calditerricola satsumensis]GGK06740.1 stage II sporulation protein M [Calditerricola satsumensis]